MRDQPCYRELCLGVADLFERIPADAPEPPANRGKDFPTMAADIRHRLRADPLPSSGVTLTRLMSVQAARGHRPETIAGHDEASDGFLQSWFVDEFRIRQAEDTLGGSRENLVSLHRNRRERFSVRDLAADLLQEHVVTNRLPSVGSGCLGCLSAKREHQQEARRK